MSNSFKDNPPSEATRTGDLSDGKKSSNVFHISSYRAKDENWMVSRRLIQKDFVMPVPYFREQDCFLDLTEDYTTQPPLLDSQRLWSGADLSALKSSGTASILTLEAKGSGHVEITDPASTVEKRRYMA
jgi:hypothetical protein